MGATPNYVAREMFLNRALVNLQIRNMPSNFQLAIDELDITVERYFRVKIGFIDNLF